jgi:hypothetical protein
MAQPEILYHYCNTDSFVSIIRSQSIRLSSLSLSNDSMEGRLVRAAILRLAERDGLSEDAKAELRESLVFNERFFDGLGFCLSSYGDLLSQWRGYADDACGVSIGFGAPYLRSLVHSERVRDPHFALHQVRYKQVEHEAEIDDIYAELRKLIKAGAFKRPGMSGLLDTRSPLQMMADDEAIKQANEQLMFKLYELAPKQFTLKASAFSEEKEWRLVSVIEGNKFNECEYRASRNRVIPFRTIRLGNLTTIGTSRKLKPIREVFLGPKNATPTNVVQAMLKQAGFGDVRVKKSKATYR